MAVVAVTHSKVVAVPDDGVSPVGTDEWNAAHVITGLENVDNTSDVNKPVSTATQAALDTKVTGPAVVTDDLPAIFDGATGKLIKSKTYAAFKALLALVKGDVGLANVDNTSDANKPVSTAQAAADAVVAANAANASNLTSGTVAIARGGTGQATAPLAFDALAPTTTRGDLIFRNATTNARLASSTSGFALLSGGAGADPAWAGFLQSGTGATTRTWQDKARDIVNIKDFGAVCDGTTDDAGAIQAAVTSLAVSGGTVILPAGAIKINSVITIANSHITIKGAGREATTITSSSSGHSFAISSGTVGTTFIGFKLTRTTAAGSSQNGFHFTGLNEVIRMDDVYAENHYIGYRFGTTSYSYIHNCVASNNYSDGMLFTNADGVGTGCQYTLDKVLVQQNNGFGIRMNASTASMSIGDWQNITTYANALGGVALQGTASFGVNAMRWNGGIVGEDGKHGVLFDSYNGATHRLANILFEIAGTSAVGRNLGTAITNQGSGVFISSNNGAIQVSGCAFTGNSWSGLEAFGSYTLVSGCEFRLNGHAALGGEQNGIYAGGGVVEVVGCRSLSHAAYGIYLATDGHLVIGNDLSSNTLGGIGTGVSIVTSRISDNFGTTINTSPWGGGVDTEVSVASAATIDIGSAGSLRVAVTGTTTVTSLGSVANRVRHVRFTGALTLTHNATSLILPGAVNRVTVAGDAAVFISDASGNWRCHSYLPTTNGQIVGTATNDNASAGNVGEIISSTIASGSAVSLTNGVLANLTSISLTAGDWDVDAVFNFTGSTTTTTSSWAGSISTTTAAHDFTGGRGYGMTGNGQAYNQLAAGQNIGLAVPPTRFSLSATTTLFAVASSIFGTSTSAVFGTIRARRVR